VVTQNPVASKVAQQDIVTNAENMPRGTGRSLHDRNWPGYVILTSAEEGPMPMKENSKLNYLTKTSLLWQR
jgi:hypothetical protein